LSGVTQKKNIFVSVASDTKGEHQSNARLASFHFLLHRDIFSSESFKAQTAAQLEEEERQKKLSNVCPAARLCLAADIYI